MEASERKSFLCLAEEFGYVKGRWNERESEREREREERDVRDMNKVG